MRSRYIDTITLYQDSFFHFIGRDGYFLLFISDLASPELRSLVRGHNLGCQHAGHAKSDPSLEAPT